MLELELVHRECMSFSQQLQDTWKQVGFATPLEQIKHGDLQKWLGALTQLPNLSSVHTVIGESIRINSCNLSPAQRDALSNAVNALIPWRKGPFSLFGLEIEAEWRSDLKWRRVFGHLDLNSKSVLDVGSGNGYFGYRMLQAGAKSVTGLDSTLLPVMQAAMVNHFARLPNVVVPVRYGMEDWRTTYDVVFSMGVIYHQKDQVVHLSHLYDSLHEGGLVVLETIVADQPFCPKGRYAGMRNVRFIPSLKSISDAMDVAGFSQIRIVDISTTTSAEQRSTKYMPFRSLKDVLSESDTEVTIEGYPAPKRAMILAEKN